MLCLVIEFEGRRASHRLGAGDFTIGSADDNHVVLASEFVSRHHALIHVDDEGVEIRDLGSRNGTVVNGSHVVAGRVTLPAILHFAPDVVATLVDADSDEVLLFPGVAASSDAGADAQAGRPPAPRETQPRPQALPVPDGGRHADDAARLLESLAHAPTNAPWSCLLETALERLAHDRGAMLVIAEPPSPTTLLAIVGVAPDERHLPIDALRRALREGRRAGHVAAARPPGCFAASPNRSGHVVLWTEGSPADDLLLAAIADALLLAVRLDATAAPIAIPRSPLPAFRLDFPGRPIVEGTASALRELHSRLSGAAASDLNVLLLGPTGVGKEIYAHSLHAQSARRAKPFRAVNSSAMPETLLEALLFGAEDGVATGVRKQRGLLRECDGGTFFLDEIGDMSPALQAKLLRVLDERSVLPVGGTAPVPVSVRFIAATNRDLRAEIRQGRFREDLYQRLRGHEFRLPSLAERIEDVPVLANAFLRDEARKAGRHVTGVTVKAMKCLMEYSWPGNIRELETTMRRLVHELPIDGRPIGHEDLPPEISGLAPPRHAPIEERLDLHRRRIVLEALAASGGNRSETARRLGIGRVRLRALIQRLGIEQARDDET